MPVYELNIDGLVGPSHHYAGLAAGNIASTSNARRIANPAAAAHQGIQKMRFLHRAGFKQAMFPPHQRPNLQLLSQLGFSGTPPNQIIKAYRADPSLLSACYSAASMWTANAATVSASVDTCDKRVHFTAANLVSNLHRHQESDFSRQLLQRVFPETAYFQHHPVLPKTSITGDEGAANHIRLCANHQDTGINLFVYGKRALPAGNTFPSPIRYPARQTLEAAQVIARSHQLNPNQVIFAAQNPAAIDQGVFHNDVIAMSNESVLILHEDSFLNQPHVLNELSEKAHFPLQIIEITRRQLSVTDAVSSYLFNSQLMTLPDPSGNKKMLLTAPTECKEHQGIQALIDAFLADPSNPITQVHYVDLKQSMQNGGGPACLRLRVPLHEHELAAMHPGMLVDDTLLDKLDDWIDRHYRQEMQVHDLADPVLMDECFSALDELTTLLDLGSIYPFQCEKTG